MRHAHVGIKSSIMHDIILGIHGWARADGEPRPGRPRTGSDAKGEQVVTAALEQAPPKGDTHWSIRSMARSAGVSQSTVSRIWGDVRPQATRRADVEAVR